MLTSNCCIVKIETVDLTKELILLTEKHTFISHFIYPKQWSCWSRRATVSKMHAKNRFFGLCRSVNQLRLASLIPCCIYSIKQNHIWNCSVILLPFFLLLTTVFCCLLYHSFKKVFLMFINYVYDSESVTRKKKSFFGLFLSLYELIT